MSEELDRGCKVGDKVYWSTVDGRKYQGILKEWDCNVAIVLISDGQEKCVEC